MKLSYCKEAIIHYALCIYGNILISLFWVVFSGVMISRAIQEGESKVTITLMIVESILMVCLFLAWSYFLCLEIKKIKNDSWQVGKKIPAKIVDAHYTLKSARTKGGVLDVSYCNGTKRYYVNHVQLNDALELLTMLLHPYPIEEKIEIPINLYQYKGNIYADLSSVDLSNVKGYEECRTMIEKKYQQ